ncbi:MAG TPA: CocE/NonD family hydrolase, partial [bacterium]|nr:CocE/NonD family hydrolase [bacterium]HQQ01055.1 CocE/NonD family hydrolase [bacterium]
MKPHKILTGLILLAAWILVSLPVQAEYEVQFEKDVMIPMRDGVKLAANIFRPKADGKFPVVLMRSPYGKGDEKQGDGLRYAPKGYVVVNQDCR